MLNAMAYDSIVSLIDAEIARLTQVRALLARTGKVALALSGPRTRNAGKSESGKKRVLSEEARKRIAEAQRKRWAAQKSKAKKTA